MREPEAEKNHVIALSRPPSKEIGFDVVDVLRSNPRAVDGEDLGRRIDRREVRHFGREPAREQAGATGKLDGTSVSSVRQPFVDRTLNDTSLGMPARVEIRAPVIASFAKPPLVVFAGARAIVLDLVTQNIVAGHRSMISDAARRGYAGAPRRALRLGTSASCPGSGLSCSSDSNRPRGVSRKGTR